MSILTAIYLGAALGVSAPGAEAGPNYEALAAELARLRTDVERLSSDIDESKQQTRSELRVLSSQKTSLEAEIQREGLRLAQLEQALGEVQALVKQAGALQQKLQPAVLAALDHVRAPIAQGLPFRLDERLAELDKLSADLKQGLVLPSVALTRLWTFVEDEFRLARENGLYRQVVQVSGEQVLADVARVGMMMLYFRTPDMRYGRVLHSEGKWSYIVYEDPADIEQTAALFESMERRIRGGFFELPNALTQRAQP